MIQDLKLSEAFQFLPIRRVQSNTINFDKNIIIPQLRHGNSLKFGLMAFDDLDSFHFVRSHEDNLEVLVKQQRSTARLRVKSKERRRR